MDLKLGLNHDEAKLLQKALEYYESDMRGEIGKTDDHDYRVALQHELERLKNVIARLKEGTRSSELKAA